MTRILMDPSLLEYRQAMADLVDELRDEKTDRRAKPSLPREPWQALRQGDRSALAVYRAGLLTSPKIELLDASCFRGEGNDLIQINTVDEYGLEAVHVSLMDEEGKILESDYALENPAYQGHWAYFVTRPIPPGARITISVMAMDGLGGAGLKRCQVTVCEE